ncbi:toprim domain-containing protein [Faecalibacillus intestinalis]|uniref:Toprim domain-containing protein n=1 Tax=Faecalibacillus intestinalis TaxID=1982626 RepID=A0AAW4VM60_9FIRM|nr:toprim domain-containing protein [Faecalibacillus intestinalis]RGF54834.1 toprim domain-containing protein [Coprobacillus sp. AF36-10BH]RGG25782.1 toprim domain-containing protein [Coprobacillus sp. AF24-1LB]RGH98890.1 toprim domain-containing protein [Coprobacillus sp. AM26-5AC]RHO31023.1 toprim domain-containing protein [Coprobacillus sp. AM17-34]MCB8562713.1 toprim domain-containing protein [Faecalibacillus intestinalis]
MFKKSWEAGVDMESKKTDLKYIIDQIDKKLSIEKVARNLLGDPSTENRNAKWNMTYKSIYKEENTPSFKISTRLNVFYCFATKNTGNVVKLYHDYKTLKENPISYEETCKQLIEEYKLDIKVESLPQKTRNKKFNDMEKNIIKFFQKIVELSHYNLKSHHYLKAEKYLENERKLLEDTVDLFNLGYFDTNHNKLLDNIIKDIRGLNKTDLIRYGILNEAGNFSLVNRIIIPKYDINGEVVSLCGRSLNQKGSLKYLRLENNSEYRDECPELDSSKYLYNFERARKYILSQSEVIIVEGYFDAIRLWEKGIYNVVALETTSMTKNQEKQLESLGPIKITCFLDADDSGRDMQLKLLENLSNKKNKKQFYYLKTFFVDDQNYNDFGKDPDEYLRDLSKDKVDELLLSKVNYRNYLIEIHINRFEIETSYTFKELYDDIGDLLNHYNSAYNEKIEQICRDKKGEELSDFYELVKYTNNIEKLYLMRYLDAEDFYCEKLLKDMRIFTNNYKIYNDFMLEIYSKVQSHFLDNELLEVNMYVAAENKNLRTYGNKKSKIIVDVADVFNKYISIELDYYENYILILNRLNDDMDSKKREENNFFDHRFFKDINDNDKRKEVTDYIEKMFEEK